MTTVDLKEFVAGFILEADEHLHSVNLNLVAVSEALRTERPEPRAVRELFRSLHTIKGISSMVGAEPIVDISHEMENILRTADRAGGRLSDRSLDLLLQGTRALEERVHQITRAGISGIVKAPASLLEALGLAQDLPAGGRPLGNPEILLPAEVLRGFSASEREQIVQARRGAARPVLIQFQPSPEKAAQGLNITSVRSRLSQLGELVKVVPLSSVGAPTGIAFSLVLITKADAAALAAAAGLADDQVQEIVVTAPEAQAGHAAATGEGALPPIDAEPEPAPDWVPTDQASVRVDIRRLDEALERLSDLIVTRSKLGILEAKQSALGIDTRELKAIITENTRQLKRLRVAITEARMVPLADLLQRLPLVVRGLTKDSQKSVSLSIHAGNAEVDKAVADKIFPAVVHLVRNSVDHAIETRQERLAAGKPETGALSVTCDDSSGTSLVLTISDDGRGVSREAVAKRAGQSLAQSNEELLQQITTAGLSTMDVVTQTSGRGMGMEIVKRSVEMLGGSLTLATEAGRGTTFTLRVPVSITIVDVLSFVAGGQVFAVPLAMVEEIIEVDAGRLVKAPVPRGSGPVPSLVGRRGETVPLLTLAALLRPGRQSAAPSKALVVKQSRGAIAFGIDKMLGQQEVVVRPLDEIRVKRRGISGATDLGDGQPTLVLDLSILGAATVQEAARAL